MKKSKELFTNHTWRFFRAGGFDQVRIDRGVDLVNLDNLDQKLWVALACPVDNVYFDKETLKLIDNDGDKRIRVHELIAAVKWTCGLLKNQDDLLSGSDHISIEMINVSTDIGQKIVQTLKESLITLGKTESDSLTLLEMTNLETAFNNSIFNGDGVIVDESVGDSFLKGVLERIISNVGSVIDRSGKNGIDESKVNSFFGKLEFYEKLHNEFTSDLKKHPFGENTFSAVQIFEKIEAKLEDYFLRSSIVDYDSSSHDIITAKEKELLTNRELGSAALEAELSKLPISKLVQGESLCLTKAINPAWESLVKEFVEKILVRLSMDPNRFTKNDFIEVKKIFQVYKNLSDQLSTIKTENLEIGYIRDIFKRDCKSKLLDIISKDLSKNETFLHLRDLEKLIRFKRDLYKLCTNFVNFKEFYAHGGPAIFQAGTLYLDQRSCSLCIRVDDINKHSQMAAMAGTYLVYCECKRKGVDKPIYITAAITNGDSENLMVGRNGIFYDREGLDWDATIVKILDNPISLRQAFWMPYKALVRMIEANVAKRAMVAETESNTKLTQMAGTIANVDSSKIQPPGNVSKKLDIGVVAALGVAAGAIGTFIATFLGYLSGIVRLGPFAVVGSIIGLFLLISGPSVALAYIKLRKRNLGPILDAGGWAVNAKSRINVPFGTVLTKVATLPVGATRDLIDPYAEKKALWPKVAVACVFVYLFYATVNHFGYVHKWTQGKIGKPSKVSDIKPVIFEQRK